MGLRVRHDDIRPAEGTAVDEPDEPGAGGPAPETPAIADERVVERDEGIEHDRTPACGPLRGGQVEVTGIPDDERIQPRRPATG